MHTPLTREEGRFVEELARWSRLRQRSERFSYNLLLAVATMIGVLTMLFTVRHLDDQRVLWITLPLILVTALLFAVYLLGTHRLEERRLIAAILEKLS